jgi:acyl carrier protein phosphodiesterase
MNWLAHALLSPPDPEIRLGNLLGDLVKGPDRKRVRKAFGVGLRLHQFIDRYTDSHPVVHRSIARLQGAFPLVGGILIDIMYDHVLAREWDRYHYQPLESFTAEIYDDLAWYAGHLRGDAAEAVLWLAREDRLTSYRQAESIRMVLQNISRKIAFRTGRELHLERALDPLLEQLDPFTADFDEFFPQLRAAAASAWPTVSAE